MKSFFLFFLLLLSCHYAKAQNEEIFNLVDVPPEYPGGFENMMVFIQKNFEYPAICREMGDQGTVYVQFIVEKDGSISNVKVVKGVVEELDAESIRVVKMMPKWSPGMMKGRPVRARFTLPIRCKLSDDDGLKWTDIPKKQQKIMMKAILKGLKSAKKT